MRGHHLFAVSRTEPVGLLARLVLITRLGLIALVAPVVGCGTAPTEPLPALPLPQLAELVREQVNLYPLMTEEDLYKVISQAARGPKAFFIGQDSGLDVGLAREVAALPPYPAGREVAIEVLDPRSNLARVNLRPFLLAGGKVDDLARAVARTAHRFRGDRAVFIASLDAAAEMIADLDVAFTKKRFRDYVDRMKDADYPAGIHSRDYAVTYEPAYRIIQLHHLDESIPFAATINRLPPLARQERPNAAAAVRRR